MSVHNHRTLIDGCFRCELNRDEMRVPEHECDAGDFDRVVCPDPCGMMHSYCSVCGELQDACALA